MKKVSLYGFAVLLGMATLFQSCDDNDGYSVGDIAVDFVTTHVSGSGVLTFTGDAWGTIWPGAPLIICPRPADGQRALMFFNPLYDNFQGYDVAVKVENIYPILTKQVEQLSAENEAEYGDDPVRITDAWVAGGHMNLIFHQRVPKNGPHRVSLVQNTQKEYDEDGYVHLEYRYKTNGDTLSNAVVRSTVSYNLSGLDMTDKKGIKMRIKSAVNGERVLTFDSMQQNRPTTTTSELDLVTTYVD